MNKEEWNSSKYEDKYYWYNKVRKIQMPLKYNFDQKAIVIHHLIDSEEQKNYNNAHYEFWGFEIDENGNEYFEYGKYVIFVTISWHIACHASLEGHKQLVGKKISESKKGYLHTEETKQKISKSHLGKPGMKGDKHPNFGKPAHNKGMPMSDEAKQRSRESHLGKSSDHLKACKILYKAYKQGNGILSWNEFQKCISKGYISFENFPITIYIWDIELKMENNTVGACKVFPKLFIGRASENFKLFLEKHNFNYNINYIFSREDLIDLIEKYSSFKNYKLPVIISDISFLNHKDQSLLLKFMDDSDLNIILLASRDNILDTIISRVREFRKFYITDKKNQVGFINISKARELYDNEVGEIDTDTSIDDKLKTYNKFNPLLAYDNSLVKRFSSNEQKKLLNLIEYNN